MICVRYRESCELEIVWIRFAGHVRNPRVQLFIQTVAAAGRRCTPLFSTTTTEAYSQRVDIIFVPIRENRLTCIYILSETHGAAIAGFQLHRFEMIYTHPRSAAIGHSRDRRDNNGNNSNSANKIKFPGDGITSGVAAVVVGPSDSEKEIINQN